MKVKINEKRFQHQFIDLSTNFTFSATGIVRFEQIQQQLERHLRLHTCSWRKELLLPAQCPFQVFN